MKKWYAKPETQRRLHQYLKYFWFCFALFTLTPWGHGLSGSIAVVFFISVYANFIAHWSTERAIDAQLESKTNSPEQNDS